MSRTGSLVFGGGHVVLPLLQAGTVTPGWVSDDAFLAGYGVEQAMPRQFFSLPRGSGRSRARHRAVRLTRHRHVALSCRVS